MELLMLNYNTGYDPYDEGNKKQHLLALVLLIRRALTLKALYEKMVDIVIFTVKRIIPNMIPGCTYYVVTRYVLHIDPLTLVNHNALINRYGPNTGAVLSIVIMSVIDLVDLTFLGIATLSQQFVFWRLFQRTPKIDKGNPPRPKSPRRRDIKFP